jgi:hypothetical protein
LAIDFAKWLNEKRAIEAAAEFILIMDRFNHLVIAFQEMK